jgi:Ca2+/H+ antiporter
MDMNQFTSPNGNALDLTNSLTSALAPVITLSVVISIVFVILYIVSMVRRWKVQHAIFDIQKNIRELNERSKVADQPPTPPATVPDNSKPLSGPPQAPAI